jgi:predicted aminopeptidase
MLRWSDDEVDGVIFHELAHQLIYVKDDTAFNESFATFVQQQGLREWRAERQLPPPDQSEDTHDEAFTALVLDLRDRLRAVYAQEPSGQAAREAKEREIAAFRERFKLLRGGWNGDRRYDAWVDAPINNARLVPFSLYDRWVPAFGRLFAQGQGDWVQFYAAVRSLSRLPKDERTERLDGLASTAPTAVPEAKK